MGRKKMPGSFSERTFGKVQKELQLQSMDDQLRNGLWHVWKEEVLSYLFENEKFTFTFENDFNQGEYRDKDYPDLADAYVQDFKLNRLDRHVPKSLHQERELLYHWEKLFDSEWNDTYDILEWTFNRMPSEKKDEIGLKINEVLEDENSGYRLIKIGDRYQFFPITDKIEANSIRKGLEQTQTEGWFKTHQHLNKARTFCFHRKSPEYEASIGRSFNACESALKRYLDQSKEKETLADMLKKVSNDDMPEALKLGFTKYYAYGSKYIRHGQKDIPTKETSKEHLPSFAEAKFFLVASHAFVNYLILKKSENTVKSPK